MQYAECTGCHIYVPNTRIQSDRSCLPEILYEKAGPGRKNAHSRILQLVLAVKSSGRAVGYNVVKVW